MDITSYIGVGRKNATTKNNLMALTGLGDRETRKAVEEARKETVIINLQDGKGYFIPDKDDLLELKHYVAAENKRALSILNTLKMAKCLLADMEANRFED